MADLKLWVLQPPQDEHRWLRSIGAGGIEFTRLRQLAWTFPAPQHAIAVARLLLAHWGTRCVLRDTSPIRT